MSNPIMLAAIQGLCDGLCDIAKVMKDKQSSGALAKGLSIAEALLADEDLKAKSAQVMAVGLSGVVAAAKGLGNLADDLELGIEVVPLVQKVIAAFQE